MNPSEEERKELEAKVEELRRRVKALEERVKKVAYDPRAGMERGPWLRGEE